MDKWMLIIAVLSNLTPALTTPCMARTSVLRGEELYCTKATASFFAAFNQPLNKTHWLTCENCSLPTIDENIFNIPNRNLTFLYLIKSQIQRLKAFAFSKLNLLKVLNLRENAIEEIHSTSMQNLKKLAQLDLSHNQITILTNHLFEEVQNLNLLNLNFNQIFLLQPEAFFGLKHLKFLYLNSNQIERLEGHVFKHLSSLLTLYLENNKIKQIDSFAFADLDRLNYLYLNNNSLNFLVQYNFKPLSNLVDLQLRFNNLMEIQTSSFNGLNNLRMLYLGKNRLKFIKPYGFVGLGNLQSLELMENKFTEIDMDRLTGLTRLNMLWLQNNQISNIILNYKSDPLDSLVSLSLSDNNLTTLNYKLLHNKIPNVKDVFIANNSWKCEFLVNMFNFFSEKSVNLCVSDDCSGNRTKDYVDEVCVEVEDVKEEDYDLDFVSSGVGFVAVNVLFLVELLLIFL